MLHRYVTRVEEGIDQGRCIAYLSNPAEVSDAKIREVLLETDHTFPDLCCHTALKLAQRPTWYELTFHFQGLPVPPQGMPAQPLDRLPAARDAFVMAYTPEILQNSLPAVALAFDWYPSRTDKTRGRDPPLQTSS